ncbi:MAG: 16S rRNA (guanine(527)-N(7))-methyltransferase RsmG [Betaproteobacteria bacterium]|nr:16S rRNA (guanine(527)-N(7))-methyltransferase RsmG [Betaproteobacteria bacterium]
MKPAETTDQVLVAAASELAQGIDALGLDLDARRQSTLIQYLVLLEKWNRVYNLTAVRDLKKMVFSHLLDSLAVLPHLPGGRVLDVGSGAGLPGIPIAVARPDLEVVLLDSNHKKAAFLRQAVADLALSNANVVCERVQSWQRPKGFDVIISRAYAEIGEFVMHSRHLLAPDGVFVAMKGLHPYEEIERLPKDYRLHEVIELSVPGLEAARRLILVKPQ